MRRPPPFLFGVACAIALILVLAAMAPRDQHTPVDPFSVPNVASDPISGASCPPGAWPQTTSLVNAAGPYNVYTVTCSDGVVTNIAR